MTVTLTGTSINFPVGTQEKSVSGFVPGIGMTWQSVILLQMLVYLKLMVLLYQQHHTMAATGSPHFMALFQQDQHTELAMAAGRLEAGRNSGLKEKII